MRRVILILLSISMGLMTVLLDAGSASAQGDGQTATVTASALNVRRGPGMEYEVIAVARRGETFPVIQATRAWTQVQFRGQPAWMATAYLTIRGTPAPGAITGPVAGTTAPPTTGSPVSGANEGRLLFATSPGGLIRTMNGDGSGMTVVGSGIDPAWSPDGSRIAYADWVTPRGIYIMNADGSDKHRVAEQPMSKAPSWSADGSRIVFNFQSGGLLEDTEQCYFGFCFLVPRDPFWRLGLIDLSDRTFREPPSDVHSFSPSFRANGDILFDGDVGIRAVDPDRDALPVTVGADSRLYDPQECQAAGKIAATYYQHDHWEVYLLDSDGGTLRRLTGSESVLAGPSYDNVAPEWNPDCSHLLFLSNRDGPWRPYIMSADGTNQRPFLPHVMDTLTFEYGYSSDRVFDWHP